MGRGLKTLFALFALVILISCEPAPSRSSAPNSDQIVKGQSLQAGDPVQSQIVLLRTKYRNPESNKIELSNCTGLVLSEKAILTAAHCVSFNEIVSGTILFSSGEGSKTFSSEQIHIHPDYVNVVDRFEFEKLRDLAVIKLSEPIKILEMTIPLLKYSQFNLKNFSFRALGYGQQYGSLIRKNSDTLELKQKHLTVSNYDPESPYFEILQKQGGVCFGDSGGPVLVKINGQNYALGLTINVLFNPIRAFEPQYDTCSEKAIFLNIPYFYDWIQKVIFE